MLGLARGWWVLVVRGLLAIAFGVLVVIFPGAGALAVVWAIGAYSILFGLLLIALGIRLRGVGREAAPAS